MDSHLSVNENIRLGQVFMGQAYRQTYGDMGTTTERSGPIPNTILSFSKSYISWCVDGECVNWRRYCAQVVMSDCSRSRQYQHHCHVETYHTATKRIG
jgi:hypothetical protein